MITGSLSGASLVISSLAKVQKNIAFAGAQALNDTARDIQRFTLQTELPGKFTLRSRGAPWQRPGNKLGFNIKPFATKDSLTATIGSQAEWLKAQEHGGVKAIIGGHRAAIPTAAIKAKPDVMVRGRKPRALLAGRPVPGFKGGAFMSKPGSKLYPGIYVRTGDGRRLKILFGLQQYVHIRPLLQFEKDGIAIGEAVYNKHFNERLAAALATMK